MNREQTMHLTTYILSFTFIFYFGHTLRFAIRFNKTNHIYNKQQKIVHNILIWLIPFLWIVLLKTLSEPPKKTLKGNNEPYNSWYDGIS